MRHCGIASLVVAGIAVVMTVGAELFAAQEKGTCGLAVLPYLVAGVFGLPAIGLGFGIVGCMEGRSRLPIAGVLANVLGPVAILALLDLVS